MKGWVRGLGDRLSAFQSFRHRFLIKAFANLELRCWTHCCSSYACWSPGSSLTISWLLPRFRSFIAFDQPLTSLFPFQSSFRS